MVEKMPNHDPEREKGSPPPQSMPALFGWITLEYQRRIAKELVEMSEELTPIKQQEKEKKKTNNTKDHY
ncbi:hypothetical protein [Fuchsiella alkaliacetigena]|uniref:hypothetical protein n=1 Tax=Fuchsiella alkaliacetigena TaxID=957042 RepID=UPI00200ADE54|nr:hypothetical protein [Fuchsiella alkaliacetigena]MCK8823846.1 hypothetical protein [Fuchsiella alkaliacetigena]